MFRRRAVLAGAALASLMATVAPLGPAAAQTGPAPDEPVTVQAPFSAAEPAPAPPEPSIKAGPGQYGPPEWLPLRNPAYVGCVRTNCAGPYHGEWAIDFIDPESTPGDPIYAAGAGQVRINETGSGCGPSAPGNTLQIDHGGGVLSLYGHLHTVLVANGQWVDQNTQLGTMGTTGRVDPCGSEHLHYAKFLNLVPVDPGPLKACHGSTLVTYPQVLGHTSWDTIAPPWLGPATQVRSDGTACAGGGGGGDDVPSDFNGDGISDVAIYRPSTGQWYVRNGNPALVTWGGAQGDIPVPADYNGDGTDDVAIYRPSTGQWFIRNGNPALVTWGGSPGDIPVPADYNGDGTDDVAIYRPSTGQWFIRNGNPALVSWGASDAVPVPADYNGDGTDEVAIYRPSTGQWFIRNGNPALVTWGATDGIPVPADYNGDGAADVAIYRTTTAQWFIRNVSPGLVTWGSPGDVPSPGDFNGGGADVAIYRPGTGQWFIRNGNPALVTWGGGSGDVPLALPWAIYDAFF
ncbi:MAG: FG-GAP-like repeat-containing protein [Acidimicrobiia bacterium]